MFSSLMAGLNQAGPVGIFVLGLLFLFSVVSWAIIFSKYFVLGGVLKTNQKFIDSFWHTKDLSSLLKDSQTSKGPSAHVFKIGVAEYERQKQKNKDQASYLMVIERSLARAGRSELKKAEANLSFLATIGAVSPFIGLFGTVVGIMSSFHQIGAVGNANLTTVAPGIAEALLATALGLFAAIPAVMAYNFFQTKIRVLRSDLDSFCLDLLAVLKSQEN